MADIGTKEGDRLHGERIVCTGMTHDKLKQTKLTGGHRGWRIKFKGYVTCIIEKERRF